MRQLLLELFKKIDLHEWLVYNWQYLRPKAELLVHDTSNPWDDMALVMIDAAINKK